VRALSIPACFDKCTHLAEETLSLLFPIFTHNLSSLADDLIHLAEQNRTAQYEHKYVAGGGYIPYREVYVVRESTGESAQLLANRQSPRSSDGGLILVLDGGIRPGQQ